MLAARLLRIAIAVGAVASCSAGPTSPSTPTLLPSSLQITPSSGWAETPFVGYAGEWAGTTLQGTPIRFTVSASDDVTFLTFRTTCSGVQTFSDLSIRIASPPAPIRPGP